MFDASASFGSPQNLEIRTAGFNQAPFFDGGTADRFLNTEFSGGASEVVLSEVALALPGMWMPRSPPQPPAFGASAQERMAALAWLLDAYDEGIRELATVTRGRWDNHPPEAERLPDESAVLELEERDSVLRATADMRLALTSENYSEAGVLWDGVQPVIAKVASYVAGKLDSALNAAVKIIGGGLGAAVLVAILVAVGVLAKADAITALLKALHLN